MTRLYTRTTTCARCGKDIEVLAVRAANYCDECLKARRREQYRAHDLRRKAHGKGHSKQGGNGGTLGRPVGGRYVTHSVILPMAPEQPQAPTGPKGRPGVAAHAPSYMAPGSPEAAEAVERAKYLLQLGTDAGNPRRRRTIAHLVRPRDEFPWLGRGGI